MIQRLSGIQFSRRVARTHEVPRLAIVLDVNGTFRAFDQQSANVTVIDLLKDGVQQCTYVAAQLVLYQLHQQQFEQ